MSFRELFLKPMQSDCVALQAVRHLHGYKIK